MTELHLPVPGSFWGSYPERAQERAPGWEHATRLAPSPFWRRGRQQFLRRIRQLQVDPHQTMRISTLSRQEEILKLIQRFGFLPNLAAEMLRRVGIACHLELGLEPTENQYLSAWVILSGGLAEIAAGEGKTIAVAMAACAAALTGVPVHVMTANDYLAGRDAAALATLYEHFGLSVGCVSKLHSFEQRRHAYRADVTYCAAREVGFDYLRDLVSPTGASVPNASHAAHAASAKERALRGLCMAILDDADATLVDEARSPMTITRPAPSGASHNALEQAMSLARRLEPGKHYRLDTSIQNVQLTPEGRSRLAESPNDSVSFWRNPRQREELVDLALYANHLLVRDRDYLLLDEGVALIDPTTGEPDAGREWNRGLIQMIALKEGVAPPPITETIAQLSLQSLLSRYHWLGGVSGSLLPARLELAVLYGLRITRIARRGPSRHKRLPTRVFTQRFLVWRAIAQRVREMQGLGRPVLIATESASDAEALAAVLSRHGFSWQILNGRQDSIEHTAISRAGRPLRITIAAQMSARGTSIALAPGVAETGGMHVICCQFSATRRVRRHLLDRTAQRGQPGSSEILGCLDQGLLKLHLPASLQQFVRRIYSKRGELPAILGSGLDAVTLRMEEFSHRIALWKLRRDDRSWRRRMSIPAWPR